MINFVAVFLHKKDGHSTALLIFELPASSPRTSRAYFLVLTVLYHDKIKMHVTKGSAFTLRAEGGVFSVKWCIFLVLVVVPIDRGSIKRFKKALKKRLKHMLDQLLRCMLRHYQAVPRGGFFH